MRLSYLFRGLPGHPLHPPLTDVTIGAYTAASAFAVLAGLGITEETLTKAWWLLLLFGLAVSALAALTGLVEWLGISRDTRLWRTATAHMLSMLIATGLFGFTAAFGHDRYVDGQMTGNALVGTLLGFGFLTLGGWIGGSVVFVHGMRVLNLVGGPAGRAAVPLGEEKERSEAR